MIRLLFIRPRWRPSWSALTVRWRRCSGCDDFLERHGRVGELADVGWLPGADQILHGVVDIPDIDVHPGEDAPTTEPERDELALLSVAAEDHLVVAARLDVPRVLHPQVVLVGVEVRHPVVGDILA